MLYRLTILLLVCSVVEVFVFSITNRLEPTRDEALLPLLLDLLLLLLLALDRLLGGADRQYGLFSVPTIPAAPAAPRMPVAVIRFAEDRLCWAMPTLADWLAGGGRGAGAKCWTASERRYLGRTIELDMNSGSLPAVILLALLSPAPAPRKMTIKKSLTIKL